MPVGRSGVDAKPDVIFCFLRARFSGSGSSLRVIITMGFANANRAENSATARALLGARAQRVGIERNG